MAIKGGITVKEQILKIVRDIKLDKTINEDAHLVFESVLNSLEILQLISAMEGEFGVKIPVEEVLPENFDTVESLAKLIEKLKG